MQWRKSNILLIAHFISLICLIESLFFFVAVVVSFLSHESIKEKMLYSFLILFIPGIILFFSTKDRKLNNLSRKESIVIVSTGWIIMAFFGAIPYVITKTIPHFSNAYFESMSGFTTTGSSILTNIEILPKSILLWRSETHWIGGMGIIVLILALAPVVVNNGVYLYNSEMSNVVDERMMTQIKHFARNIWLIYIGLTILEIIILCLAGMPIFDSVCHSFATIATGGFSTKNDSIAAYSPLIQYIIMVFMLLSGMNFTLHVLSLRRQFRKVIKNEELQFYLFIILITGISISLALIIKKSLPVEFAIRSAFFQVISVITATGFVSADYLIWPSCAIGIIMLLMLIGASSGSTGGGVKVIRNLIAIKKVKLAFKRICYPNAVNFIRYNGETIKSQQVASIIAFIILYYSILAFSTLFLMCLGLDGVSSFGSVITTMGGIGPGFGSVGPVSNFSHLPDTGKYFLTFIMVLGRLEIYPLAILFTAWFWKNN